MAERLTVLQAGIATVTDLGRTGMERHGIPVNGAADQYSATLANILVGNPAQAALVEITASDFALSASQPVLIAATGAPATLTVDGQPHRQWEPICVDADRAVALTGFREGLRGYLAIHGILHAPQIFGSCAPDSLLGIGTRLRPGTHLELDSGYARVPHPFGEPLFRVDIPRPAMPAGTPWTVDVVPGPEIGDFPDATAVLTAAPYTVSPRSNHIGLRLDGAAPARARTGEILSRGVPVGAVEVPPSGELLVLQRGRPVTAGYPVVAVAARTASPLLAQAMPGRQLRLRFRDISEAVADYRTQQHRIRETARRVHSMFTSLGIPLPTR
jgi:5-oxoprolinase (ATP-hydrolysing) subunit C